MKRATRVFLSTLALAIFFLVPTAFAQSVSGGVHVVTDEGTRHIEFNARLDSNGASAISGSRDRSRFPIRTLMATAPAIRASRPPLFLCALISTA